MQPHLVVPPPFGMEGKDSLGIMFSEYNNDKEFFLYYMKAHFFFVFFVFFTLFTTSSSDFFSPFFGDSLLILCVECIIRTTRAWLVFMMYTKMTK